MRVRPTFPDVQPHGQAGRMEPEAHGDEEHVGHDVVQAERDEGEDGPPHGDDLGVQVLGLHGQVAGQAHEPVAADAAQQDLVEGGRDLLLGYEGDDLVAVWRGVENTAPWPKRKREREREREHWSAQRQ